MSGSALPLELLSLELLLELLLLESSPGSRGAGVVGNGWSVAAELGTELGVAEAGVSGEPAAALLGEPGNGNCSATDGFFAGAAGVHG